MTLSAHCKDNNEAGKVEALSALLSQCQLGNEQAFAQLYQQTSARLNGIAYRITRNVDSANEVLQEAFIQIWQNRKAYNKDKSEPFTWLASIVRYRAYDRLRYEQRRHHQDMLTFNEADLIERQLAAFYNHSEQHHLTDSAQQALFDCLQKLDNEQKQTILMAYLYGYSRQDISTYFDSPINTIKSWIRRGLGRLQLCLSD